MNKNKIFLAAESAILNPKKIKIYPNLSVNYSVYLNRLLYSNWLDIFDNLKEQYEIFSILSDDDKEYIPKYFIPSDIQRLFFKDFDLLDLNDTISRQLTDINSKTLILFFNSIGIKQNDFSRIFNLIQPDEPSIVIGRPHHSQIVFVCSYGLEKDLIKSLVESRRNYESYLNHLSSKDLFIHILDKFLSINDFEDIKKLYIELSKKESLAYCSQKMHESFNDLFIEYKELLDV